MRSLWVLPASVGHCRTHRLAEVRDVALSPDKLDSQLTISGVVTVFEESHLHVLVFTWRLRIVRSEETLSARHRMAFEKEKQF